MNESIHKRVSLEHKIILYPLSVIVTHACTCLYTKFNSLLSYMSCVYTVHVIYNLIVSQDDGGRYAYNRQPSICRWNLGKLAEALSPCLPDDKAKEGLEM